MVRRNALSLELLGFRVVLLIVRSEQVDIVVVFLRCLRSGNESLASGARARKGVEFGGVGLDVGVPACYSRVGGSSRGRSDGLKDMDVCLGWNVSVVKIER